MSSLFQLISQCMLGLAVYVGGWYVGGSLFQVVQLGAIGLFIIAGVLALTAGGTRRIDLSAAEYILGGAFMFGMVVAFVRGNALSTEFGAMFLLVLAAAGVLARQQWVARIELVFRWAYIALIASVLVVQPTEFLTSVVGTVERSVGLVRFMPLGMHPNLCGLVYGGGSLLFFQHFLTTPRIHQKLFALLMSALCLGMILAASSRASLLALAVTGLLGAMLIAWRGSRRARGGLILSAVGLLAIGIYQASAISDYLTVILDLDSPTRGTESGATGREDIWRDGVDLVFSDPVLFFTGRGVRAAGPEVIGFPVESSYINLALEHGVVFGLLIVLSFGVTAIRTLGRSFEAGVMNSALIVSGLMLVFVLLQSVFNRYLVAVGNPYSLWVLLLLVRLNLRPSRAPYSWMTAPQLRAQVPLQPAVDHNAAPQS
jgi:exopolysaccharide production protein ExoQ